MTKYNVAFVDASTNITNVSVRELPETFSGCDLPRDSFAPPAPLQVTADDVAPTPRIALMVSGEDGSNEREATDIECTIARHQSICGLDYKDAWENARSIAKALEPIIVARLGAALACPSFPQGGRMSDWQPIATAPTDTPFIAAVHVSVRGVPTYWQMDVISVDSETGDVSRDDDVGWSLNDYTDWQPLPVPPSPKVAA